MDVTEARQPKRKTFVAQPAMAYPAASPPITTQWLPPTNNFVWTSNQTSSYVPGAQLLSALSQSSGKG